MFENFLSFEKYLIYMFLSTFKSITHVTLWSSFRSFLGKLGSWNWIIFFRYEWRRGWRRVSWISVASFGSTFWYFSAILRLRNHWSNWWMVGPFVHFWTLGLQRCFPRQRQWPLVKLFFKSIICIRPFFWKFILYHNNWNDTLGLIDRAMFYLNTYGW